MQVKLFLVFCYCSCALARLRSPAGECSGGKGDVRDGMSSSLGDGSENHYFCDKSFFGSQKRTRNEENNSLQGDAGLLHAAGRRRAGRERSRPGKEARWLQPPHVLSKAHQLRLVSRIVPSVARLVFRLVSSLVASIVPCCPASSTTSFLCSSSFVSCLSLKLPASFMGYLCNRLRL